MADEGTLADSTSDSISEAERIAGSIQGSHLHIMEMTGHGSPFFRPGLFVDIVNAMPQTGES